MPRKDASIPNRPSPTLTAAAAAATTDTTTTASVPAPRPHSYSNPTSRVTKGYFERAFGFEMFSSKKEYLLFILLAVLATLVFQSTPVAYTLLLPSFTFTMTINLKTLLWFLLWLILWPALKSLVTTYLPLASLLFYLDWILPLQRLHATLSRISRVLVMSQGYETVLWPYLSVALLRHLPTIVSNIDHIEPHFPTMMNYIDAFGPHLCAVLPIMPKLGPHLDAMMPLMPAMEDYLADFLPHLPDLVDDLPYMLPHMPALIPHFGTIVPLLPALKPHMKKTAPHIHHFVPHLPVIMRNMHYIAPHMGLFMAHIDALLPTLGKSMVHLDGMAPHFDAMAPSLPKFIPIIDRVIDHLPSIIPRLGDTLINADAVLNYLGWTVNTPLVNTLNVHGTSSTVVKLGRSLAPKKKSVRVSLAEAQIKEGLERMSKLDSRIVHEGWIQKRSTSAKINSFVGKLWKNKWVVIDNTGCMSVYKESNKSSNSLRFRMYLGGCTIVESIPGKAFKIKSGEGKVKGRSYTHYFRCKTLDEYCAWVMNFRAWEGTAVDFNTTRRMSVVINDGGDEGGDGGGDDSDDCDEGFVIEEEGEDNY
jgi:hypothetical protein